MRLFKRRPKADRSPRTGHAGDDALLAEIGKRSNLDLPRHWVHYLYCADKDSAQQAETEIRAGGWDIQRVDQAARGPGWVVIAERHRALTSPDAVRDARAFFEGVASRVGGGDYDGWQASL